MCGKLTLNARGTSLSSMTYDIDFHDWTQKQSALLLERLAERPQCFEGIDVIQIAEEISDLGNSERRAVASNLTIALIHMIKIASLPDSTFDRGWRSEVIAALRSARRTYTKSMHQRLNFAEIWNDAYVDAVQIREHDGLTADDIISDCPVSLEELLDEGRLATDFIEIFKASTIASRAGREI